MGSDSGFDVPKPLIIDANIFFIPVRIEIQKNSCFKDALYR